MRGGASHARFSRSTFPFLFAAVSFAIEVPIKPAFAGNECGAPAGVVTCGSGSYSPLGITYDPFNGTLNVETGAVINRAAGTDFDGIYVHGASGAPLTVNLANGVVINTEGLHANGLEVEGFANITITSAANITVNATSTDFLGTNGVLGRIRDNTSNGNITINQLQDSTITVIGDDGSGLYGINAGSGSVTVTSSGSVSTTGIAGYGLNAWNTGNGTDTTVILNATGTVATDGDLSVGLYSLNGGHGNAFVYADGKVTTNGFSSDGALADIDNSTMTGKAQVVLSNTANIHVMGDASRGAWALNWGVSGDAIITSAGTVVTDGADSYGLESEIRYDPARRVSYSSGNAIVSLQDRGTVVTKGTSAYGIYANSQGFGAATVTMDSGSSVTTTGMLADGVRGESLFGMTSLTQATGAPITVSGAQAFGVNLIGNQAAFADLRGTISSSGEYGVGASSFSNAGPAEIAISAGATVTGGWQADIASLGGTTNRPSTGVLIGSNVSSQLTNLGTIGAGSDRAIADIGRYQATTGNLVIDNAGLVTGFIELAAGRTNVFNNNASGVFDVRHFADTDGDGARDTKRVSISDFGAATSTFNNRSGATVRLAPVVGETKIEAAGYYTPTTGIDSRPLEASYYTLGRSGVVQGQLTNLGTFHNAGIIDLRGSATGNTLVMTGNASAGGVAGNGVFISDGGRLLLNAVLNGGVAPGGQTGSFSDVLVVDSTKMGTGATTITIDRREGAGAATPGNGILLVEVRDKAAGASAPGVFVLNGDYVVNGQQAVVKGAYAYNLFQNGVAGDSADGNWYLRNSGLAPNVPVYEEYPKVIQPLLNVPTLQQRVGNRYWNAPAPRAPQTVFCKDPAKKYQCALTDEQASYYVNPDGTVIFESNGVWGRVEAGYGRYQPSQSTSGANYNANTQKIQVGRDGLFFEGASGKLVGGITGNYGHVSADVTAAGSKGHIRADGYGLGGTLTWYGTNGFYADAQAQATWFVSDLNSATLGGKLIDGNKGFGYTLSLETGQRIALDKHWTMTPQAQLIYLDARFDSFTDRFGSAVSLSDGASLRGRIGLALEHQERWKQDNGTVSRIGSYGIANLYNEFRDGTRVNVSGTTLASRDDRLWGGLGIGGSYNWNDDKYSIYGQVVANTGLAHLGDSLDIGGTIGLRVKW